MYRGVRAPDNYQIDKSPKNSSSRSQTTNKSQSQMRKTQTAWFDCWELGLAWNLDLGFEIWPAILDFEIWSGIHLSNGFPSEGSSCSALF